MAIKESSDELNPIVMVAEDAVPLPRAARSFKDYFAIAVATCGVGYLPLAPGTWGSLVGVGTYLVFERICTRALPLPPLTARNIETYDTIQALVSGTLRTAALRTAIFGLLIALLLWLGTWAASRTEKLLGRKDPRIVVIDEVAGQLLTFILIPMPASLWVIFIGFLLFRFFDIVKPYPARRLESLESGLGIMADDAIAGVYATLLVALAVSLRWMS